MADIWYSPEWFVLQKGCNFGMNRKRRKRKEVQETQHSPSSDDLAVSTKEQQPDLTTLVNQAISLHQEGNLKEAEKKYDYILKIDPTHAVSLNLLGVVLSQTNRHHDAIDLIRQALAINPEYTEAYNNLGMALQATKQLDSAIDSYLCSLKLDPHFISGHYNLGNTYKERDRFDEAIDSYCKTLALNPRHLSAYINLGIVYREQGKFTEAINCYQRALELDPNFADTHNNLGNVYREQEKFVEAINCYQRALELDPNFADAHNNLGNVYREQGKFAEAINCHQRALELDPNSGTIHNSLGIFHKDLGKVDEAIECYQRALELKPTNPQINTNLAMTLLLKGDFENGWKLNEWRLKQQQRDFLQPFWDGSSFEDKTLLIYSEQGLGDTIQFVRFLPTLAKMGNKIAIQCQDQLKTLLQPLESLSHLVGVFNSTDKLPHFDICLPLMSLPYVLGISHPDKIPNYVPYLYPNQDNCYDLPNSPNLKVGLVWAGNPSHKNDRYRSIELKQFIPLFKIPDCEFYSLQVGERVSELRIIDKERSIVDLGEKFADFSDTASALSQLDLLISVDTSVAHLAGAMAKPVWNLLPANPDWRWLLDREETPWYPTMRLFRQKELGQWDDVIEKIRLELANLSLTFRRFES
ncbi:MAG: tetratricopeptide repeat protein [Candidatus Poribacteria bacterium]|nr:tetratricopeptide repeat protein [Candidatus Poribacteria bacterium]